MTADDHFEQIAGELEARGASTGAMFGKRALKANGKAFACLLADTLAFRLGVGTAEHTAALDLPGAILFDPSGQHRPFKDWVAVPLAESTQWPRLAEAALATVS